MAYRRRPQPRPSISPSRSSDHDEFGDDDNDDVDGGSSFSASTSLAARAIRASSAAHRDSSLSSAYGLSNNTSSSSSFPATFRSSSPSAAHGFNNSSSQSSSSFSTTNATTTSYSSSKDSTPYQYTSMKSLNDSKQGFWDTLARKAKSFLEDDVGPQEVDSAGRTRRHVPASEPKNQSPLLSHHEGHRKTDSPALNKGLNAIASSLNYIGNAVEEGITIVENRTAGIIQETRKHIKKKPTSTAAQNQTTNPSSPWQQPQLQAHMQPQLQADLELQLKASRDVAMAMAAKAKLLLRELKTVKADLAFAKERCAQLEEENKILRENREQGENPEDDDLIRLQLETLLAEKARLAHDNSVYARENRFLREVVEYHQLTMQDVVYLDEGTEEVTEVYPIKVVSNSHSVPTSLPPSQHTEASLDTSLRVTRDLSPPQPVPPPGVVEIFQNSTPNSYTPIAIAVDTKKHPNPSV